MSFAAWSTQGKSISTGRDIRSSAAESDFRPRRMLAVPQGIVNG